MHLKPVSNIVSCHSEFDRVCPDTNVKDITQLRERYRCPRFCILVIGRANAGKTTILEKVCAVVKGTKPIIVYDKKGKLYENPIVFSYSVPSGQELASSEINLNPSIEVTWMANYDVLIDHNELSARHTQY